MAMPAAKKQRTGSAAEDRLLIGVPKKGRLANRVLELLKGAGLDFYRAPRLDIAQCTKLPITIVFLPAADIATFVGEGSVDMGITGEDIIAEHDVDVRLEMNLGFGKCRLCVQAPVGTVDKSNAASLVGKRIATSFPLLARKHFDGLRTSMGDAAPAAETKIREISGSVEAACGLGLADAVVDLVETGTTMKAAGLEIVDTIMTTQTVLISNKKSPYGDLIGRIRERIKGFIDATKHYLLTYNVERKNLAAAAKITPGHESPTVQNLDNEGWVAVSAMVDKKSVSDIMDQLKDVGATSILALDIKNCRF